MEVSNLKIDTGFELRSPRRSFSTTFCQFLLTLTFPTGEEGGFRRRHFPPRTPTGWVGDMKFFFSKASRKLCQTSQSRIFLQRKPKFGDRAKKKTSIFFFLLMCWCVDVLMCWCVDHCVNVLMCWYVDVCWCVDVLRCWCVDVLIEHKTHSNSLTWRGFSWRYKKYDLKSIHEIESFCSTVNEISLMIFSTLSFGTKGGKSNAFFFEQKHHILQKVNLQFSFVQLLCWLCIDSVWCCVLFFPSSKNAILFFFSCPFEFFFTLTAVIYCIKRW